MSINHHSCAMWRSMVYFSYLLLLSPRFITCPNCTTTIYSTIYLIPSEQCRTWEDTENPSYPTLTPKLALILAGHVPLSTNSAPQVFLSYLLFLDCSFASTHLLSPHILFLHNVLLFLFPSTHLYHSRLNHSFVLGFSTRHATRVERGADRPTWPPRSQCKPAWWQHVCSSSSFFFFSFCLSSSSLLLLFLLCWYGSQSIIHALLIFSLSRVCSFHCLPLLFFTFSLLSVLSSSSTSLFLLSPLCSCLVEADLSLRHCRYDFHLLP